jgi:hypothetical protein
MWGGIVNYRTKVITGRIPAFSLIYFFGEIATSGFAGVLVWHVCEALHFQVHWVAAFVGIAGHMGGRAIEVLEVYLQRQFSVESGGPRDR